MARILTRGIGSHHGLFPNWTDDWQTPPHILEALGEFDMDPCASANQVHRTARAMLTKDEHGSGLLCRWIGRVWCNPPYGRTVGEWLDRLAAHGNGIALIFARTDTEWFQAVCFGKADGILFLAGRVAFIKPDGKVASHNSGGPSCLVAYGQYNASVLANCKLPGMYVGLK